MSSPAATIRSTAAHAAARRHRLQPKYPPLFIGDWLRVLFIHYEVEGQVLPREVPFELDRILLFRPPGEMPFRLPSANMSATTPFIRVHSSTPPRIRPWHSGFRQRQDARRC